MIARYAIVIFALLASRSAIAENLDAEAARNFVVGKLFAFPARPVKSNWRA